MTRWTERQVKAHERRMIKKKGLAKLQDYIYVIGIDTGVNTGVAAGLVGSCKFEFLDEMKIHQAMGFVKNKVLEYGKENVLIYVEDARKIKLPKKYQKKNHPKYYQGIGSVKRDAKIWDEYLFDLGFHYKLRSPLSHPTKVNEQSFKERCGSICKSEHARDAGSMIMHEIF